MATKLDIERMQAEKKILNLLGLAQRANRAASGNFAVMKALESNKSSLLLVAGDAAKDTKDEYLKKAGEYEVPVHCILTREKLGHCLGKDFRAAVAILDAGFAKGLEKWIGAMEN